MHESVHGVACRSYSEEECHAWSPAPRVSEDARQRFAGQHLWIAEDQLGPCSFMSLRDDGYLDFAYSLPRAAGRGAASMIYEALEAWATNEGYGKLTSDVSLVARPFFEKRGWAALAAQYNDVRGVTLINFRMEKKLSP